MSQKREILKGKMPVAMLQEICARANQSLPVYQYIGEEISPLGANMKLFTHQVSAYEKQATGVGRSKQESKHEAAWQLLRILLKLPADETDDLVAAAEDRNSLAAVEMALDRVAQLRDICIQRNFPLPEFEQVQNYGPSHAPVFVHEVRIRDIVRRGTHSTKKGAKQIACWEMIKTLQAMPVDDHSLQLQTLQISTQEVDEGVNQAIRTYREYTQSDIKKKLGVSIADRHQYFIELPKERIAHARRIMANPNESMKEKCSLIPAALGMKCKITLNNPHLATLMGCSLHSFELINPDYDCFIYAQGDELYQEVFHYFDIMLRFQ